MRTSYAVWLMVWAEKTEKMWPLREELAKHVEVLRQKYPIRIWFLIHWHRMWYGFW